MSCSDLFYNIDWKKLELLRNGIESNKIELVKENIDIIKFYYSIIKNTDKKGIIEYAVNNKSDIKIVELLLNNAQKCITENESTNVFIYTDYINGFYNACKLNNKDNNLELIKLLLFYVYEKDYILEALDILCKNINPNIETIKLLLDNINELIKKYITKVQKNIYFKLISTTCQNENPDARIIKALLDKLMYLLYPIAPIDYDSSEPYDPTNNNIDDFEFMNVIIKNACKNLNITIFIIDLLISYTCWDYRIYDYKPQLTNILDNDPININIIQEMLLKIVNLDGNFEKIINYVREFNPSNIEKIEKIITNFKLQAYNKNISKSRLLIKKCN